MATVYTLTSPSGQTVTLVPGAPFETYVQRVDSAQEAAWSGVAQGGFAHITLQHPGNALAAYSADDLARYGITVATVPDPTPAPAPPPTKVSMRQAQLALYNFGLLNAVNAAVAAADMATQIEWKYASAVDQADPHFQAIVKALGWPQSQVDALFAAAAQL